MKLKMPVATGNSSDVIAYYQSLRNAYPDLETEDFQNLVKVYVSYPSHEIGRLHVMIFTGALAAETLPKLDHLIYGAIHLRRDFNLPESFSVRLAKEDSENMHRVLLKRIEILFQHDRLFYVLTDGFAEELTQAVTSAYSSYWDELEQEADAKMYGWEIPSPLVGKGDAEVILMHATGELYQCKSAAAPHKYLRKDFCNGVKRLLAQPTFGQELIFQKPDKKDGFSAWNGVPPLHMGWYENVGYWTYSGINFDPQKTMAYGNQWMTLPWKQMSRSRVRACFETIPMEAAAPLMAYLLFSATRPFIKGYPYRIDTQNEKFYAVRQKQKRLIYMNLRGEDAERIARAFYGAFVDYGSDNTHENRKLREKRVHDGVVIIDSPKKKFEVFMDTDLLRDACIVCTDGAFAENVQEISLYMDFEVTDEQLEQLSENIQLVLRHYLHWMKNFWTDSVEEVVWQCKDELWKAFASGYKSRTWYLSSAEKEDDLKRFKRSFDAYGVETWDALDVTMEQLGIQLKDQLHTHWKQGAKGTGNVEKWFNKSFLPLQRQVLRKHRRKMEKLVFSKFQREEEVLNADLRARYLLQAMDFFYMYMEHIGFGEKKVQTLSRAVSKAIRNAVEPDTSEESPVQLMESYISHLLEEGRIIPSRVASSSKTAGWYDSRKNLVYLPYVGFEERIREYRKTEKSFRYVQSEFFADLAEAGVLLVTKNGKNSTYIRADHKVVVAPAAEGKQKAETVLKIAVDQLTLSEEARAKLAAMDAVQVARRSRSKKE